MGRKLRVFLCELVGVGLLLAWLMWKYPELVDSTIPWVAFAVLWHATWEFVIEPTREWRKAYSTTMPTEVKWIFDASFIIALSIFYHHEIENGMIALNNYHLKWEETHRVTPPLQTPSPKQPSKPKADVCAQLEARDKEIVSRLLQKADELRNIEVNCNRFSGGGTANRQETTLRLCKQPTDDFYNDQDNAKLFAEADQLWDCEMKRKHIQEGSNEQRFADRKNMEASLFRIHLTYLKQNLLGFPE